MKELIDMVQERQSYLNKVHELEEEIKRQCYEYYPEFVKIDWERLYQAARIPKIK